MKEKKEETIIRDLRISPPGRSSYIDTPSEYRDDDGILFLDLQSKENGELFSVEYSVANKYITLRPLI